VVVGAGATLFLLNRNAPQEKDIAFTPMLGRRSAGLSLAGRF